MVWRDAKVRRNLCLAALSIGGNWGAFIYCVASGQTTSASFAYFVRRFYGVLWALFLQGTAECLAAICGGVIDGKYLHQAGGRCVVIPRAAVDGTMCGLLWRVGKQGALDPMFRMWVETVILLPVALVIVWVTKMPLVLPMWEGNLLLMTSGAATALPLILFMAASKRLPQTVLAILQYLNPALMLAVSVFLFQEPWHLSDLLTYSWVVAGSIVFVIGLMRILLTRRTKNMTKKKYN